jgi:hypothetical protein
LRAVRLYIVGRGSKDALLPILAGFLLGSTLSGPGPPEALDRAPAGFAAGCEREPDRMCFRDLQRLPAIGPARALGIVEARHERGLVGGPAAWSALAGIGDETVRSVEEALEASSRHERGEGSVPERTLRPDHPP